MIDLRYKFLNISILSLVKFYFFRFIGIKYLKFKTIYGKVYLDIQNKGISKQLALYYSREKDKLYLLEDILKKDDYVIDCGSNIGVYPFYISNIIKERGKVYCIEPDPRNIETLKKNLTLLRSQYSFDQVAIHDTDKEINFLMKSASNLGHIHYNNQEFSKKAKQLSDSELTNVKGITLNTFLKKNNIDLSKIKLIRMDIEGSESEVIDQIYDNHKEFKNLNILFENHPEFYSQKNKDFKQILLNLVNVGYRIKYVVSAGEPKPKQFKQFDLNPIKIIDTDGYKRGIYLIEDNNIGINLITSVPKIVRYALIVRNNDIK